MPSPRDGPLPAAVEAGIQAVRAVERGKFHPSVDRTFPHTEIVETHRYLYSYECLGKVRTIGTLLLAKKRTLIPALRPLLLQVRSSGYFLSTALIEAACESAGE